MPGETAGTGGRLLVIGADNRTTPAWRDHFARIEANLTIELDRLRARGFDDLTLLATCDRIELITIAADAESTRRNFGAYLAEHLSIEAERLTSALYVHEGADALLQARRLLDGEPLGHLGHLGRLVPRPHVDAPVAHTQGRHAAGDPEPMCPHETTISNSLKGAWTTLRLFKDHLL